MRCFSKILLVFLCVILHTSCFGTNVFITNNSPFKLCFKVLCLSKLLKKKKHYKVLKKEIEPWEHQKILHIKREKLPLKDLHQTVEFQLEGEAISSKWDFKKLFSLYVDVLFSNEMEYGVSKKYGQISHISSTPGIFGIKRAKNVFSLDNKNIDILYRDVPKKGAFNDIEYVLSFQPGPIPKVDNRSHVLHLFQQNLYMRPKVCCAFANDGQIERANIFFKEMLASGLESKPDVITLNEVFDLKSLNALVSEAKKYGYKYRTSVLASWSSCFCSILGSGVKWFFGKKDKWPTLSNGGVIIFSRFPIKKISQVTFSKECSSKPDSIANKGCLYAKINKKGKIYHVFATHTDSVSKEIRIKQYDVIKKFIEKQKIPKNQPVIIVGDMNMCSFSELYKDEKKKMLKTLNAKIIKNTGFKYSLARKGNAETRLPEQYYNALIGHPEWARCDLDLMLCGKDYLKPVKSYRKILSGRLKYSSWVTNSNHPYFGAPGWEMSDHQGVYGYFEFKK
ncbi:sphingomyelin phosphodiesterase [Candidatus Dependentiae bacterium]